MSRNKLLLYVTLIVLIAVAMSYTIYLQTRYLTDMRKLHDKQFVSLAKVALSEAVASVEKETLAVYTAEKLREAIEQTYGNKGAHMPQLLDLSDSTGSDRQNLLNKWNNILEASELTGSVPDAQNNRSIADDLSHYSVKSYPKELLNAYIYYRELLIETMLSSLSNVNNDIRPLRERISYPDLTRAMQTSLEKVGITDRFIYRICDKNQRVLGQVGALEPGEVRTAENTVRFSLFDGVMIGGRYAGYLEVTFPHRGEHREFESFVIPLGVSTVVIVTLCLLGILFIAKQILFEKNRTNFAKNLTHELKTPLTSILIVTEMLEQVNDPERRTRMLNALKSESKRLSFLVEKTLQFTLMDSGSMRFTPADVNVHQVMTDVYTIYRNKCEQLGGSMSLELNAKNFGVYVDKMHFQNVIFNLVDNAIKYRKEDVPIRIVLRTEDDNDDRINISVEDNGIGIAAKDRKLIFKRYYRVDTGNVHNVKGFGLGLSYVQMAVKAMSGTIRVGGKKGEGTKMIISLPSYEY